MASSSTAGNSERTSALAERLGMSREAIEELLQQTHSGYANASTAPVEPRSESPIEEAAKSLPSDAGLSSASRIERHVAKPLSGGLIAAMFLILLIGLGIAISFKHGCFARREAAPTAVAPDTISSMMKQAAGEASTPPLPPSNVSPNQIPPEALAVPQEEPPAATSKLDGRTSESQVHHAGANPISKPVLVTSSNFQAEEELAKLRADGKAHAYMTAVHRHRAVTYRIYPTR